MLGEIITKITVEYHIYYNGTIKYKLLDVTNSNEKRTDQELINERKVAKYIYYDKNNNKHKIGSYHIKVVNNLYSGSDYYKDRLGGKKIYLMDMRNKTSYFRKIDGLEVKFKMNINTVRYYANDITAASLLGAMLNTGYIDFTYNGSSNEKGQSIGGSITHKNGINLDMRYLRTDQTGKKVQLNLNNKEDDPCGWKGLDVERENKFLDELTRFGWKDKLSWEYWIKNPTEAEWKLWYNEWRKNNPNETELPVLKNITHNDNHHDHLHLHLHLQKYSPILEKINK